MRRRLFFSVATSIFGAAITIAVGGEAQGAEGDLLIRAAKVHTMTGEPLSPGAVLVSKGKIAQVAPKIEPTPGTQVIDLGQGELMPGLVEAQGQVGIAGRMSNEGTREVTPNFRIADAIDPESRDYRQAFDEGITTMALLPGTDNVVAGIPCAVKTVGANGDSPRMLKEDLGTAVTVASDPGQRNSSRSRPDSIYVRQPTNRMGVIWILRETLQRARDGSPGDSDPGMARIRETINGKHPVFSFTRTSYDTIGLLRIAGEFKLSPTIFGGQEAHKIVDELKAAKISVVLDQLETSRASGSLGREDTEIRWNLPGVLERAGIPFALSEGNLLDQARFAVRQGASRSAALTAITAAPARILGIDDRVGSIAPGKDADLIALSGDPLEFTTSILWVRVEGVVQHPRKSAE